jgi:hypothetical protein
LYLAIKSFETYKVFNISLKIAMLMVIEIMIGSICWLRQKKTQVKINTEHHWIKRRLLKHLQRKKQFSFSSDCEPQ